MIRRRKFMELGAFTTLALTAGPKTLLAGTNQRVVRLYETHRQETLTAEYWRDGWYNPDVLAQLSHFVRDWRTDETTDVDPGLLDILFALQRSFGADEPLHIVCGYRSPTTNAQLRRRNRRVARNSYHITGQACDIRLPGKGTGALREQAVALEAGGVGYYPRSGFIHVDTGPVRTW